MNDLILVEFEGHEIHFLTLDGRPGVLVRSLGTAIGYADEGKSFAQQVTDEWNNEFVEGQDYRLASYEELSAINAKGGRLPPLSPRGALVLFESGVYLALLLSKKDAGRRLRRKLADEVFPQLARDGRFDPRRQVVDVKVEEKPVDRITRALQMAELLPEERRAAMIERLIGVVVPEVVSSDRTRSQTEKREAVAELLAAEPGLPNREITRRTGTSHTFIAQERQRLRDEEGRLSAAIKPAPLDASAALRKVLTWARAHRGQLWALGVDPTPPPGGWLGRWDARGDLSLPFSTLAEIIGGRAAPKLTRIWAERGLLVRSSPRHLTDRMVCAGTRLRCYRFDGEQLAKL